MSNIVSNILKRKADVSKDSRNNKWRVDFCNEEGGCWAEYYGNPIAAYLHASRYKLTGSANV